VVGALVRADARIIADGLPAMIIVAAVTVLWFWLR
jgi:hypothetical protein